MGPGLKPASSGYTHPQPTPVRGEPSRNPSAPRFEPHPGPNQLKQPPPPSRRPRPGPSSMVNPSTPKPPLATHGPQRSKPLRSRPLPNLAFRHRPRPARVPAPIHRPALLVGPPSPTHVISVHHPPARTEAPGTPPSLLRPLPLPEPPPTLQVIPLTKAFFAHFSPMRPNDANTV